MVTFPLTIATVDTTLFNGEVLSVTCPGMDGELTLLPNHTALITTLKSGNVTVREDKNGDVQTFEVKRGLLEVGHNRATILI